MRAGLIAPSRRPRRHPRNDSGALLWRSALRTCSSSPHCLGRERRRRSARRFAGGAGASIRLIPCANRSRLAIFLELPGRVNRHVEALAEEFLGRGHHVRVLAPFDPPDRSGACFTVRPRRRERSRHLVPLGRTAGFAATARSPTSLLPSRRRRRSPPRASARAVTTCPRHEPVVPLVGWNARLARARPS